MTKNYRKRGGGGSPPRSRGGVSHRSCSQKRKVLKERIRDLEQRVTAQAARVATYECKVDELILRLIENDILK